MNKFTIVLLLFLILGFTSCFLTKNYVDLSSWSAESENVSSLSVLLEDDGVEGNPVVLNENTIIFESNKNDNYDLWTINLNKKSGIIQLTTYDGPDRLACVHPDKKRYCFLSDRSETGFYMGEIGKPTVISLVEASKPNVGQWVSGDISPDGNTLLYVSGKYIWTYDFVKKTRTQFVQGTEPRWAPDGNKIIFRKIAKQINNQLVSTSIWTMNRDGTEQTELISGNEEFSYNGARFSPDGSRILYLKRKIVVQGTVRFENPDIWICNSDGTDHTQITTHPLSDQDAVWLDNKTIIFCSDRPQSGNISDKQWDIWKLVLYE